MRYAEILPVFLLSIPLYSQTSSTASVPDSSITAVTDSVSLIEAEPAWVLESEAASGFILEDGADAVSLIPGLQALDYGSLGQFSPLLSHAGTPPQTTVLFDGTELRDPILGSLSTIHVPTFLVRTITFSGNRGFSPYGSVGPAGEIGLVPLDSPDEETYSKVFFRAGDWEYSDLGAFFGIPLSNKTRLVVAGDRQELDGFISNSKHTGSRILGRLFFTPASDLQFRFTSLLVKNNVKVPAPALPDLVPFPSEPRRKDKRWDHIIEMQLGDFATDDKKLNVRAHITQLQHKTISDSVLFDNRTLSLDLAVEERIELGGQSVSFGGNFMVDKLDSEKLGNHSDILGALFVRYHHWFFSGLRFGVTGRAAKHHDYAAVWNALANIEYHFSREHSIWLGVRYAHRYPGFAERYWPTSSFSGQPDLKLEKHASTETGLETNSESFSLKSTLHISRVTNFIEAVLTDSRFKEFGPENLGTRTHAGVNLKFRWHLIRGGELGFSGSYYHFFDDNPDLQLHIPDYIAYAYLDYSRPVLDNYVNLRLRLMGRVFGERPGRFYQTKTSLPRLVFLPTDAVIDLKTTFEISDADIFVSWENLLDRRYEYLPGFFMPPRTLRFGIDWQFHD